LPADVVTKRTPFSATKSTMPGSWVKSCAMFHAPRLVGQVTHLFDLEADLVEPPG